MYWKIAVSACRRVSQVRRQISLDRFEERFHSGIVIALSLAAYRDLDAVLKQDLLTVVRTVLAAHVAVKMQARGGVRKAASVRRRPCSMPGSPGCVSCGR